MVALPAFRQAFPELHAAGGLASALSVAARETVGVRLLAPRVAFLDVDGGPGGPERQPAEESHEAEAGEAVEHERGYGQARAWFSPLPLRPPAFPGRSVHRCMVGKCDLSSAAASAISGLGAASAKIDRAAATVAAAGARASDTVEISDAARKGGGMDDVKALVDMRMARYELAAEVRVLRTVDEMSDDLKHLAASRKR